ncbi:MAG: MBOAT family O-acyltransferase [Geminicoccaceae bacterium]
MLFNSPIFIYFFLPVVVFIGLMLKKSGEDNSAFLVFISAASIVFYGYSEFEWVFIIVLSIVVNYTAGDFIIRSNNPGSKSGGGVAKPVLIAGITFNLLLLFYFKYVDFLLLQIDQLFGGNLPSLGVVLPIGISFYTFQQIAFLADAYRGEVRDLTFKRYVFFVTFFPQLIAGPIVHHREILPQLAGRPRTDLLANLTVGLCTFLIGLTKKVLFADSFARIATPIFQTADAGGTLSSAEAWTGAIAYALQIYFDFSGYSDMAIGIALMFGIYLPINFASPYKSVGIIEFWRRWHITLSRFLRDYLYIPLGGNQRGPARRYVNLMLTMVLGGLWHGAGWGFVIWGLLHGLFLAFEHALRAVLGTTHRPRPARWQLGLGWALTFGLVVLAWVPFRATTLEGVQTLWAGMAGFSAAASGDAALLQSDYFAWIAVGLLGVLLLPNSQEIVRRLFGYELGTGQAARTGNEGIISPAPPELMGASLQRRALQVSLAASLGFGAAFGIAFNNQISEFIYFQF